MQKAFEPEFNSVVPESWVCLIHPVATGGYKINCLKQYTVVLKTERPAGNVYPKNKT